MQFKIQNLRPTGNRICLKNIPLKKQLFESFKINFFSSGTAALSASILACHSKRKINRPEVILPAYSCPDLISAILHAKAKPVLVDLEPNSTFLSLSEIKKNINENTLAIIAINFLGIPDRAAEIKEICSINNIFLIEDSAQGLPVSNYNDYWRGDIVIISFGRGKPLNLLGGGATLINKNSELYGSVMNLQPLQSTTKEKILYTLKIVIYNAIINPYLYNLLTSLPGINIGKTIYKPLKSIEAISEVTLSILQSNLNLYNSTKQNTKKLSEELSTLKNKDIIDLIKIYTVENIFLRHPFIIKNQHYKAELLKNYSHLGLSEMYKLPLNKISGLENTLDSKQVYPNANQLSKSLITFPTHCDFKTKHIIQIKNHLNKIIKNTT